ncbi:TIGR04282 family arsenosugar biosynthesis glycosyltransferase [Profundibacterium mesophilum]|nr:TIGR04282 family arsenosugar biosynthesis glycosyltransferase [Profundibacterium mesophilum]
MVKEPRPGRVKTRLGREVGMTRAAWWFRRQTSALLRRLDDPRWECVLAVSPDAEGLRSRVWPPRLPRLPQGRGDLGARMARLLRGAPPGPAIVIGADIPGIERRHVARAFAALGRHDGVIGPAPDGGYWLVGLRRRAAPPPGLFRGVEWSSGTALADTVRTMPRDTARIDTLADVDTLDDLRAAARQGRTDWA